MNIFRPASDLDTALRRHRKVQFDLWKTTPDRALLKRLILLQLHLDSQHNKQPADFSGTFQYKNPAHQDFLLQEAKSAKETVTGHHRAFDPAKSTLRAELKQAAELRRAALDAHESRIMKFSENSKRNDVRYALSDSSVSIKRASHFQDGASDHTSHVEATAVARYSKSRRSGVVALDAYVPNTEPAISRATTSVQQLDSSTAQQQGIKLENADTVADTHGDAVQSSGQLQSDLVSASDNEPVIRSSLRVEKESRDGQRALHSTAGLIYAQSEAYQDDQSFHKTAHAITDPQIQTTQIRQDLAPNQSPHNTLAETYPGSDDIDVVESLIFRSPGSLIAEQVASLSEQTDSHASNQCTHKNSIQSISECLPGHPQDIELARDHQSNTVEIELGQTQNPETESSIDLTIKVALDVHAEVKSEKVGSGSELWPPLESQAQPELQVETEPAPVHNLAPAAVSILASDANVGSKIPSPASELAQGSGPELMKEEVLAAPALASELHLSSDPQAGVPLSVVPAPKTRICSVQSTDNTTAVYVNANKTIGTHADSAKMAVVNLTGDNVSNASTAVSHEPIETQWNANNITETESDLRRKSEFKQNIDVATVNTLVVEPRVAGITPRSATEAEHPKFAGNMSLPTSQKEKFNICTASTGSTASDVSGIKSSISDPEHVTDGNQTVLNEHNLDWQRRQPALYRNPTPSDTEATEDQDKALLQHLRDIGQNNEVLKTRYARMSAYRIDI